MFALKFLLRSSSMYIHYLLVLLSNLLLLLLLLFGIVIVHLGLCEAGDEVVKDAKELIGLGGRRVLAEHPANPVEPAAGGRMVKRKTSNKLVLDFFFISTKQTWLSCR